MNTSDQQYFKEKLTLVIRDLSFYTPEELARQLVRYAFVAESVVATQECSKWHEQLVKEITK